MTASQLRFPESVTVKNCGIFFLIEVEFPKFVAEKNSKSLAWIFGEKLLHSEKEQRKRFL